MEESRVGREIFICIYIWASLVAEPVKNLPAMQETPVLSLGWEDPWEKEMVTHSSILVWRIPWTEVTVRGVRKSWIQLTESESDNRVTNTFPLHFIYIYKHMKIEEKRKKLFMMRPLRIYCFNSFLIYHTTVLTRVIMLSNTSPKRRISMSDYFAKF